MIIYSIYPLLTTTYNYIIHTYAKYTDIYTHNYINNYNVSDNKNYK